MAKEAVLVGTSSWSEHAPFYPPGTTAAEQLPFYARYFPIVEVNTTYYRVPPRAMVAGWVERTPDDFIFDVKPPRELTSTPEQPRGEAPEPDADLARAFLDALVPLIEANKLGALSFQFPPSYRNTEEHRDYLKLLPELFPDLPISVEFRRRDWLDDEHADDTLALLCDAGLSYTMVDEPQIGSGSVPPIYGVTNPKLAVVRFHGRNQSNWYHFGGSSRDRFDWNYSDAELAEWLPNLERAQRDAERVHVFFNTNRADQGMRNAARLMDQLKLEHPALPELDLSRK